MTYGEEQIVWNQIAFSCRDILQDFTDAIFKPECVPCGSTKPTREQTKNKLRFTLKHHLKNKSGSERELLEVQTESLINYIDKVSDLVQKGTHKRKETMHKDDVSRIMIHMYLVIGDTLKLLKL